MSPRTPRFLVLLAAVASWLARPATARAQYTLTVHSPSAGAPTVPPLLAGMNLVYYGADSSHAPVLLDDAPALQIHGWRIPGGSPGNTWHFLTGQYYDCNWVTVGANQTCTPPSVAASPPEGPSFDQWVQGLDTFGATPITELPWEASEQEMLNLVEYANLPVPASPDPSWTPTSYPQDAKAPAGYFAWLRGQRLHAKPVGVGYWELGNELFGGWEDDRQTHNDGGQYGTRAAQIIKDIHALDPASKVGVVGLWGGWDGPMWSALAAAGTAPDFFIEHSYMWFGSHPEDAADALDLMKDPDALAGDAATIRAAAEAAFPGLGAKLQLFYTEFGPDANFPTNWEVYNVWSAIYVVLKYGEGLQAGWSNLDFFAYTQGNDTYSAVATSSPPYASTYFGAYLWGRFVQGGESVLTVDGASGNVFAFGAQGADGTVHVLVVNRDPSVAATATVTLPSSVGAATAHRWRYDGTLGGMAADSASSVRHDLTMAPAEDDVPIAGGQVSLSMAAESVMVLSAAGTAPPRGDGGVQGGGDGGSRGSDAGLGGTPEHGCSCDVAQRPQGPGLAWVVLLAAAALWLGRRRRS